MAIKLLMIVVKEQCHIKRKHLIGIMMELNEEETLTFRYFVDKLIGFSYNGSEYIYKRDILGNITHIIDSTGQVVAQYIYDAWGNHKALDENGKENTDEKSLCNLNPFRYKGYFYDVETGFYYCNTRYYNPEWGRWLTPDSIDYLEPQSINGLNLYCYCGNNPIMYYDPTGHSLFLALLILTVVFIVAGGIYGGVSAAMAGENVWEGIGKGMLVGGVFAAALALTIGGFAFGWTTVLGFLMITYGISVMSNMVEVVGTQWHKSDYDGDDAWNKANDITNASFANLGRVLIGSTYVPDILILGSKVISKIPLASKFFDNVSLLKQSYSTSTAYSMTWNSFWSSKASFGSLFIGYLSSIIQIGKALYSIFGEPDIENSRWILY